MDMVDTCFHVELLMQGTGCFLAYPQCWNLTIPVLIESIALPLLFMLRLGYRDRMPTRGISVYRLQVRMAIDFYIMSSATIEIVNNIIANIQTIPSKISFRFLCCIIFSLDFFPVYFSLYPHTLYQALLVFQYDRPHLPDAATHLPQLSHKY